MVEPTDVNNKSWHGISTSVADDSPSSTTTANDSVPSSLTLLISSPASTSITLSTVTKHDKKRGVRGLLQQLKMKKWNKNQAADQHKPKQSTYHHRQWRPIGYMYRKAWVKTEAIWTYTGNVTCCASDILSPKNNSCRVWGDLRL